MLEMSESIHHITYQVCIYPGELMMTGYQGLASTTIAIVMAEKLLEGSGFNHLLFFKQSQWDIVARLFT